MSAPPSTRTNMRLDGNKFQRCQSALSHYRKRPPAGGSKAQMDCEPFMPDALRDRTAWLAMSDSNSETSSQIIPLKARADFQEFSRIRPPRLFAFELRRCKC